jgi:hypothetical protein
MDMIVVATREVWIVWTNVDLTEGRGREYAKAYCELETTARRIAKGSYVMGTDCRITKEMIYADESGRIYAPGANITPPTSEDKRVEKTIEETRVKLDRKEKAIARAKNLGLTNEEIEALRYTIEEK